MKFLKILILVLNLTIFFSACDKTVKPDDVIPENSLNETLENEQKPEPKPDKRVIVEITPDNFYEYFNWVKVDGYYDSWGEWYVPDVEKYDVYMLESLAYSKKGLVLLNASGFSASTNGGGFTVQNPHISHFNIPKGEEPTLERCQGEIIYIHKDDITAYVLKDKYREVKYECDAGGWSYTSKDPNISVNRPH